MPKTKQEKLVPDYPDERLGNFMRGLVLGALAGGVAALFSAQRSGAEARQELQKRLQELMGQLSGLRSEASTTVADLATWAHDRDQGTQASPSVDRLTLVTPLSPSSQNPTGPLPIVDGRSSTAPPPVGLPPTS